MPRVGAADTPLTVPAPTSAARPDDRPGARPPGRSLRARLRRRPGLVLVLLGSIVASSLAASAAPTPLYAVYQSQFGFSPVTTTAVYGVYGLSVLVALLVLGRLSDHVGRRPVLLAGIAGQVLALAVLASAQGTGWLYTGRVLQGLAFGAAAGALGAGLVDVDPARGATANAVSPGAGTALGALLSAVAVQTLPAPRQLTYLLLAGVFVLQAVAVVAMPETAVRAPGARRSLVPQVRLPARLLRQMAVAAPLAFAVGALGGFYGSLGPTLVAQVLGDRSTVLGALSLATLTAVGAASVVPLRRLSTRDVVLVGAGALATGVAMTLVATGNASAWWLFVGTAVAGVGFGSGLQGVVRLVVPVTLPTERAGVLSLLWAALYLGMSVPVVAAGLLVVHGGGFVTTTRQYGVGLIVLAALSLAALLLPTRPAPSAAAAG